MMAFFVFANCRMRSSWASLTSRIFRPGDVDIRQCVVRIAIHEAERDLWRHKLDKALERIPVRRDIGNLRFPVHIDTDLGRGGVFLVYGIVVSEKIAHRRQGFEEVGPFIERLVRRAVHPHAPGGAGDMAAKGKRLTQRQGAFLHRFRPARLAFRRTGDGMGYLEADCPYL